MVSKRFFSWGSFEDDCLLLAKKIKNSPIKFKSIVAITRGGLFVAGMLAYLLDIRDVKTLHIESYDTSNKKGKVKLFSVKMDFTDCLLVDDLIDTGDTLRSVLDWDGSTIATAVLYKKKGSFFNPSFYSKEFDVDWIVFPWDEL